MNRGRGFTLLETMLAAAIGALVVGACVGVFAAVENQERRLRAREEQVQGLSRLHTVMRRAFSTMMMAEPVRTSSSIVSSGRPGEARESATAAAQRNEALQSAKERAQARMDAARLALPPRMLLESDRLASEYRMNHPSGAVHSPGPVQHFELLLTAHPLPTKTRSAPGEEAELVAAARERAKSDERGTKAADASSKKADPESPQDPQAGAERGADKSDEAPVPHAAGAAVRGAFELRPTVNEFGAPLMEDGKVRSWTLYWQPLEGRDSSAAQSEDGTPAIAAASVPNGPPVEVAGGLEYVHWQVFRERERRGEHRGVWASDLPAYIEMEVKTVDGLWANWMFEVDWVTGSETPDQTDDGEGERGGAEHEAGGTDRSPAPAGSPGPKVEVLKPAR